jgi:RNA 2',3'-cyclic 3'-phosphodiesterase
MRLFIGIPLAAGVVEELAALTERLKSDSDGLRWSARAGWHITLQFLGKTSTEQYACLVPALRQIRFSPFAIQLEPPGFFDRVGVFFAGVGLSPQLVRLQELVVAATRLCGFVPEDRPYHPHITLARTKAGRSALAGLKPRIGNVKQFSGFTAREFLLYESFPGPGGSQYEGRDQFALGEKGAHVTEKKCYIRKLGS